MCHPSNCGSLLQNIVCFIGLFCKRDLYFADFRDCLSDAPPNLLPEGTISDVPPNLLPERTICHLAIFRYFSICYMKEASRRFSEVITKVREILADSSERDSLVSVCVCVCVCVSATRVCNRNRETLSLQVT